MFVSRTFAARRAVLAVIAFIVLLAGAVGGVWRALPPYTGDSGGTLN